VDGQQISNHEEPQSPSSDFQYHYGKVLWNFYQCSGTAIEPYDGTITVQLMYGSILAPDADITVKQNMNGTVIGQNVIIEAEIHRDDFVGELPPEEEFYVLPETGGTGTYRYTTGGLAIMLPVTALLLNKKRERRKEAQNPCTP
jgi:hypothetical protein